MTFFPCWRHAEYVFARVREGACMRCASRSVGETRIFRN